MSRRLSDDVRICNLRGLRLVGLSLMTLTTLGCGGGSAPPTQTLVPLFEGARIDEARVHAADLMAQADAAREEALRAEERGEGEAARELATEARLWLAAALAHTDEQGFARQREADRGATEVAEQQTLERTREREQIVEREADAQVRALALEGARRAFEHAAGYEARRLRRDDPDTRALYRETSRALQQRAGALLAAARALGAPPDDLSPLESRLTELRRSTRAELVVAEADQLVHDALALLGRTRAALPEDPTEGAALLEGAHALGLEATRGERGVELRGRALDRAQPGTLRQLAALLEAHPRGGVQLLIVGPRAQRSAGRRRANALRAGLERAGVAATRLSTVEVVADVESPGLALALPAY